MNETKIGKGWIVAGVLGVLALVGLWFLRPLGIIHAPIMAFYKHPLTWMLPLATLAVVFLVAAVFVYVRRGKSEQDTYYYHRRRGPWEVAAVTGVILAPIAFCVALIVSPILTGQAIYNHYGPFERITLPESSETRIMPKTVAGVLARNGFASPTETLENAHIIQTDDGLRWTFGQSPDGVFRRITKKTAGSASLDANVTTRNLRFYKGEFQIAPGQVWADGVTWKAYKRHYFSEVAESIYLPGPGGGKILAPYIKYEGFFVKVPVLGGAYLLSPDGTMEDLSPEEAAAHPEIRAAGRLFPAELARRIQDSFVYTGGIWNRIFTHRDVLTVEDRAAGDANKQPHYLDVDGQGEWVSVAEPWGRADAVGGIFFTDALSGETSLWRSSPNAGLTSSRRAQDATESLAIPGVSFRAGDFRAIEPRPVFRDGKLLFLVSIIPQAGSTVSKSVVIEPRTNKAVAIFSHTDDPTADERLLEYLRGGDLQDGAPAEPDAPDKTTLSPSEREVVEDLLRQNESQRRALLDLLSRVDN